MVRRVLAICGAILLLAGIGLAIYLHSLNSSALASDKESKKDFLCGTPLLCISGSGSTSGQQASEVCPSSWSLDISQRVISQNDTLPLNFVLSNQNDSRGCTVTISLNFPGFDPSPNTSTIMLNIPSHTTIKRTLWFLTPKMAGQLYVDANLEAPSKTTVSADSIGETQAITYLLDEITIGINVRNVLGVSPTIAAWISLLSTIFGGSSILLTIFSKLWDKIYKGARNFFRRKRNRAGPASTAISPPNLSNCAPTHVRRASPRKHAIQYEQEISAIHRRVEK